MKYTAVVNAIRRIIERWTVTRTTLTANANAGDTSITVSSTKRFAKGDQFLIHSDNEDMENDLFITSISGRHTINFNRPLIFNWRVADGGHVVKTLGGQFVKAVYFGEPAIISNLPAITVALKNTSSDFMTLRGTKERYDIEIGVYVSGTTQEEGDRFLADVIAVIDYGLKRNFYPLLDDYETTTLLEDVAAGDRFIEVADTSIFTEQQQLIMEDFYNIDVLGVVGVCDSNTLQLGVPAQYDFDKDDTIIIRPNRLPYNSWPTGIRFGLINKGTLLKACVMSYFIEEYESQPDASFGDTQLR